MSQHLSPRWGHVILVNGYPVLITFPWCGRQTDRHTGKWLPNFKFLGWIKNQILLAVRLSSRRLIFDNISVVRKTDGQAYDKWLPKFKFLGWIKNQILLAMRLSSRRLAHSWSSAKTYLNLKTRKCLFSTLTLLDEIWMFRKIQVTDHFGLPHGSATLT